MKRPSTPHASRDSVAPLSPEGDDDTQDVLFELAADLAGQFELRPLLSRILHHAVRLLGCESGSICTVNEEAGVYRKEIDLGVACQSGETFPLTEGVTGEVVRKGGPVLFDEYSQVKHGHAANLEQNATRAVIGVPIVWSGRTIGSCVVFGQARQRVFDRQDARVLEMFARHAAIAITNSRLLAEARRRNREATAAMERERALRDIHDTVGRGLAEVLLQLDRAEHAVSGGHGSLIPILKSAEFSAQRALTESRRTVLGLIPGPLMGRSLADAIGQEVAWIKSTGRLSGELVVIGDPVDAAAEITNCLFKLTQEALTNVISHAHAKTLRVGLVYAAETVSVIIEDDGDGFDPQGMAQNLGDADSIKTGMYLGLRNMIARADHVGGSVTVDSTPGWGTRVRFELPYEVTPGRTESSRRTVLLAHDRPLVRAGLAQMLRLAAPDIQVVGEVSKAEQTVPASRMLRPDVLLVGATMPGLDTRALLTTVQDELPTTGTVFILHSTPGEELSELAKHGARGFITMNVGTARLVRTVLAAARGDTLVPSDVISGAPVLRAQAHNEPLTKRELEVRDLVISGLPNKVIATRLHLSIKTVERHVGSVLRKTGAHNRTMLTNLSLAGRAEYLVDE